MTAGKTTLDTLKCHVRHSNLIEGIIAFPGESLFDNHLRAAILIEENRAIIHPNDIHAILLDGILPSAGHYRKIDVCVGNISMPRHNAVPWLMERWWSLIQEIPSVVHQVTNEKFCDVAFYLHDFLLCIHPYRDGNGRTARLVLNMLRQYYGLPWYIIRANSRAHYYEHIRLFEESSFKEEHPDVY